MLTRLAGFFELMQKHYYLPRSVFRGKTTVWGDLKNTYLIRYGLDTLYYAWYQKLLRFGNSLNDLDLHTNSQDCVKKRHFAIIVLK